MDNNAQNRQRLRPWLEGQLDGGKIPGLEWCNDKKTLFKIPWKHGGKQDWQESDSAIFREWATHTGRFRPGIDSPDWATWKTRLRCAFNKAPDIKEKKELSRLDGDNPYRVYELLAKKAGKTRSRINSGGRTPQAKENITEAMECDTTQSSLLYSRVKALPATIDKFNHKSEDEDSGSLGSLKNIDSGDLLRQIPPPVLPPDNCHQDMSIKDEPEGLRGDTVDGGVTLEGNTEEVIMDTCDYPSDPNTGAPAGITGPFVEVPSPFSDSLTPTPSPFNESMMHQGPPHGDYPVLQPVPVDDRMYQAQNMHTLQNAGPPIAEENKMIIKISYRSAQVVEFDISEKTKCRLYYGALSVPTMVDDLADLTEKVFGPRDAMQLSFPPVKSLMQSETQLHFTESLLRCMDRGLVLECENGDIYAIRLCRCVVFYASSSTNGEATKLEREQRVKIFDYQGHFLPNFNDYASGKSSEKPSVEVHLGFGQRWSLDQPIDKILISAKVINAKARTLIEQVSQNTSPSVILSSLNDYDHIAGTLREMSELQIDYPQSADH